MARRKRKLVWMLAAGLLSNSVSTSIQAQTTQQGSPLGTVGILAGFRTANGDIDNAFYGELSYLFRLSDHVAFGPGIGYSKFKSEDGRVKIPAGDGTMIPVLGKLRITGDRLYFEGGVGKYLMKFSVDAARSHGASGRSVKDAFGGFVGLGVNALSDPNLRLAIHGMYDYARTDVSDIIGKTYKVNFGSFVFGATLSFLF